MLQDFESTDVGLSQKGGQGTSHMSTSNLISNCNPQKSVGAFISAIAQITESESQDENQESALLKSFPSDLQSPSVVGNFKTFTPSFVSSLLNLPVFRIMHFNINRIELCNLNF